MRIPTDPNLKRCLLIALTILAACRGEDPVSSSPVAKARYDLLWRDSISNTLTRPVVDDSNAYFFDYLRVVTAIDKRTGRLRWRRELTYDYDPGLRGGLGMALAGGRLVIGDLDVFGLDRSTGFIVWRFSPTVLPREHAGRLHLTTDGTTVYTGSITGRVYAVDGATGVERWRSQAADSIFAVNDPVLADGVIYVALSMGNAPFDGGVAAVRAADGQRLWFTRFPTQSNRFTGVLTAVGVSSALVFAGAEDDRVVGLDRQTGAIRVVIPGDTFRFPGAQGPASALDFTIGGTPELVVVGSSAGMTVGLDGTDGHTRWKTHVDGSPFDMRVADGRAYIACSIALDVVKIDDGSIAWSVPVTDFPYGLAYEFFATAPAIDDERVYLGGERGIYAFKRR